MTSKVIVASGSPGAGAAATDEAFAFASTFGRGCARQHVTMFSNADTLAMPGDVRRALRVMFDRVAAVPGVESVAVCLFNSFLDGAHERAVGGQLAKAWTDQILPAAKEIEKGYPFEDGQAEADLTHVIQEIVRLTGTKQKIIYQPLPKDDPKQRQPDITKARQLLGWEPKISRAEGLRITYEYFKSLPREVLYQREHKNFEKYIR